MTDRASSTSVTQQVRTTTRQSLGPGSARESGSGSIRWPDCATPYSTTGFPAGWTVTPGGRGGGSVRSAVIQPTPHPDLDLVADTDQQPRVPRVVAHALVRTVRPGRAMSHASGTPSARRRTDPRSAGAG